MKAYWAKRRSAKTTTAKRSRVIGDFSTRRAARIRARGRRDVIRLDTIGGTTDNRERARRSARAGVGVDRQDKRRHAMLREFKAFLMRGNVLDLAVAVVLGASFGAIITSFVNDLLMPPIGLALGRVNFADLFVSLSGQSYPTLAAAKTAGAPTINYGAFINTVINFVIVALVVFMLVRQVNRMTAKPAPAAAPSTKECAFCASMIPLKARRCPHCTSDLARA
jgi:large conductance mechanosensitive channel